MSIKFISPKKSVNSAFLKIPVSVENMDRFKMSLANLYAKRDLKKDEEYHKNEIQAFLKKIFNPNYDVQVNRPIDLAIFNGNNTTAKPIIDAKKTWCHLERNVSEVGESSDVGGETIQRYVAYLEKQENEHVYYLYCVTDIDKIEAMENR